MGARNGAGVVTIEDFLILDLYCGTPSRTLQEAKGPLTQPYFVGANILQALKYRIPRNHNRERACFSFSPYAFDEAFFWVERLNYLNYVNCADLLYFTVRDGRPRTVDMALSFVLKFLDAGLFLLLTDDDRRGILHESRKWLLKALEFPLEPTYHEQFSGLIYMLIFSMPPEHWSMETANRFDDIMERIADAEKVFYGALYPKWQKLAGND